MRSGLHITATVTCSACLYVVKNRLRSTATWDVVRRLQSRYRCCLLLLLRTNDDGGSIITGACCRVCGIATRAVRLTAAARRSSYRPVDRTYRSACIAISTVFCHTPTIGDVVAPGKCILIIISCLLRRTIRPPGQIRSISE